MSTKLTSLLVLAATTMLACSNATSTAAPSPSPTSQTSAGTLPTAAGPSSQPVSEDSAPPSGFSCANQSGGSSTAVASAFSDVRGASHSGFDRFVVQFTGEVPGYKITRQPTPNFNEDASGKPVSLAGSAGITVRFYPVDWLHNTYTGSGDLKPGGQVLKQAHELGDFEGTLTWGLGLSRAACTRAFTLASPSRMVLDIQH